MKYLIILSTILIGLSFAACTSGYPLKSVDYNDLFCDGNSKVWVVDKMILKNVDIAQKPIEKKDLMIFHESGVLDFLPMKALGNELPRKGRYYLDSDKRLLSITFDKEEWIFELPVLEEDRVVLRPTKKGNARYTIELIPLPEL